MSSASMANPQSWNRYSYALNNPLSLVDRTGMAAQEPDQETGFAVTKSFVRGILSGLGESITGPVIVVKEALSDPTNTIKDISKDRIVPGSVKAVPK
jgi:hypothetical protein